MTESDHLDPVDQELQLADLLTVAEQSQVLDLATALLGQAVAFSPEPTAESHCVALLGECEPLGYLCITGENALLPALVAMINERIHCERKYRMASAIHEAVVASSYAALQRKHKALIASETRYRRLANELEKRVAKQIHTINRAERKLYEAEKLSSVGQLAAGVAHEINNPVGFISSNLNMAHQYVERLQRYVEDVERSVDRTQLPRSHGELPYLFEDFADLLKESADGCERVTKIVRNLKDFSNLDGQTRATASLNKLVATVCQLYGSQLPVGVVVKQNLQAVPDIELNPGMVSQLLAHLLTNAIEAVRHRPDDRAGRIVISTEAHAGGVRLKVADNGCGMANDVQQHAFDPFYTTRAVGAGTGLGLTVSRDVVLAHGGEISLASQLDRGTVVTVTLPLVMPES